MKQQRELEGSDLLPLKKKKVFMFGYAGSLLLLGLSLAAQLGTTLQLQCLGPSLQQPLLQQSTGSWAGGLEQVRHAGSAVSAPGLESIGSTAWA